MIVVNEPYTDQLYLQKSSWLLFTSVYFNLIPQILRGSIDQKHAKTNEVWRQNSEIHPAFACSRWPPWFLDLSRPYGACVKRGSGKHMFGLSLFRPSRQSNISTLGLERFKYPLPWENKIIWPGIRTSWTRSKTLLGKYNWEMDTFTFGNHR